MAARLIPVINSYYCAPDTVNIDIVRKVMRATDGIFVVKDVNGKTIFKVKDSFFTLHDRRVLLDSAGNPLVILYKQIRSMHDRWNVFRGTSTEPEDLIFTVKRSSSIQWNYKLHVFLASNTAQDRCDFKVKDNVIYAGESSTVVAYMQKKDSVSSFLFGKDTFMLTMYPNIDYAFIVTVIVILDEISDGDLSKVIGNLTENLVTGIPTPTSN
ncbi:Protein LURP-one-related 15 [Quillaja saponaria]|uniref:Protein LURP-one-related 15 n=2 Tax=Quillaja saponaria TaxID=32244 RepID=A0AAD7PA09_QUISA|nr:Protein LURP-one-related 15 [Quillaja saponaria]